MSRTTLSFAKVLQGSSETIRALSAEVCEALQVRYGLTETESMEALSPFLQLSLIQGNESKKLTREVYNDEPGR